MEVGRKRWGGEKGEGQKGGGEGAMVKEQRMSLLA